MSTWDADNHGQLVYTNCKECNGEEAFTDFNYVIHVRYIYMDLKVLNNLLGKTQVQDGIT